MTETIAAQAAKQVIDAIMEQAQVFASAWAFYGGPFDQGDGKEQAEREEATLRNLIRDALPKLPAEGVQAGDERTAVSNFERYEIAHAQETISKHGAQHPDDVAVDRFAAAMKSKLAKKRADGRGGWQDKNECSAQFLSELLRDHVEKGDPLDVGNFSMMLHQRGERIAALASAPVAGEYTSAMGEAAQTYLDSFPYAHKLPAQFRWADLWEAMRKAGAHAAGEAHPVAWHCNEVGVTDIAHVAQGWREELGFTVRPLVFGDAATQASEAVRNEALYLLREARALLPAFATAEAIGAWSEKVNRFAAGDVIDIPPQADKDGGDCAKGAVTRLHGLVEEAISWLETGGGRADSLCADLRKALASQKHDRQQKYWLCCGSTDPYHGNRYAPDCYKPSRATWGTADQHSKYARAALSPTQPSKDGGEHE